LGNARRTFSLNFIHIKWLIQILFTDNFFTAIEISPLHMINVTVAFPK